MKRHFYRVNFEVKSVKSFPYLAFPHFVTPEKHLKTAGFDGELIGELHEAKSQLCCYRQPESRD